MERIVIERRSREPAAAESYHLQNAALKPHWRASVVFLLVAVVLVGSCADSAPSAADVTDIMAEAAGTKAAPRWGDSKVRRAVRSSFRSVLYFDSVHETEVGRRFRGPYLSSYFMLPDSYVGGDFPRTTAGLLREVQQYNREYLQQMESYPSVLNDRLASVDLPEDERRALAEEITRSLATQRRPILDVVSALDTFVVAAANLYEFVATNSRSIKYMRDGLEISDDRVLQRFNSLANDVDRAHVAADTAMRRLKPEHQVRFSRMGLTKRIE